MSSPPSKDSGSPPPPPSNNNNNNNNNDNNNNGNNNKNNNNSPPESNNSNNNNKNNSNNKSPPQVQAPPPPPPRSSSNHAISPPKKSSGKSSKSDDTNEKAIMAGAAAGAALLLFLIIICMVCCCCRKKKKRRNNDMHYYGNVGNKDNNGYYNPQQHGWNQHQPQSGPHMPPPPLQSGPASSEQGWGMAPPPPPPPMMNSSDMSSAAYSGPWQGGQGPLPPPHPGVALGFNKSTFTYDDLAAATRGFDRSLLLGQGGFGYVHKGVLPNGKEIAVKSLKAGSGQGEREFQAEVDIISRVHHRHLVSLVGYCIAGQQRMLVYEFIANNTLEYHLYGAGRPVMDCSTRLKIALGSAKGFAYLHEDCHPRIIHRDIKAANILIDDQYEAKVADFGLAKLSSDTNTHVSTRIMGTFGYLAPEYASSGKLTEKSDVYSYGVVLLELITGRRPVDPNSDDDSLIDWARPILMHASDGGSFEEMVDPRLGDNYDRDEMHRMVACAAACIRHSARRRPKMSQIVRALEGDVSLDDLNEGGKSAQSAMYGSSGSSEYDSHSYNGDIKRYRKGTLSSQEFTSSEYGTTGEYARSGGESQEMRPRNNTP